MEILSFLRVKGKEWDITGVSQIVLILISILKLWFCEINAGSWVQEKWEVSMYFKNASHLCILSTAVSTCLGSVVCYTVSEAFRLHGGFTLSASCLSPYSMLNMEKLHQVIRALHRLCWSLTVHGAAHGSFSYSLWDQQRASALRPQHRILWQILWSYQCVPSSLEAIIKQT